MTQNINVTSNGTSNKRPRSDKDIEYLRIIGGNVNQLRSGIVPLMTRVSMIDSLKQKYGRVPGFNTSSISAAEKGQRALSPYTMVCLAKYFNKPLSWFFGAELQKREKALLLGEDNKHILSMQLIDIPKGAVLSLVSYTHMTTGYYVIVNDDQETAVHIHIKLDNNIVLNDGFSPLALSTEEFTTWKRSIKKSSKVSHFTIEL